MMKTAQTNSNRIVGISSDDFFHINTKDNKVFIVDKYYNI